MADLPADRALLQELVRQLGGDRAIDAVSTLSEHPIIDTLDSQYLALVMCEEQTQGATPTEALMLLECSLAMTLELLVEKKGVSIENVCKFAEVMRLARRVGFASGNACISGPNGSA